MPFLYSLLSVMEPVAVASEFWGRVNMSLKNGDAIERMSLYM